MVNKDTIERIENLRIALAPRAELILTYLGLRPAAQFNIWGHAYNDSLRKIQDIPPQVIDELAKTLDETGLRYKIAEPYYIDKWNPFFGMLTPLLKYFPREIIEKVPKVSDQEQPVYVAQDSGTLDRLLEALPDRDHKEYGILMGYPETAIQAFVGELERYDGLPHRRKTLPFPDKSVLPIFHIALSKEHYPEELKVLKAWTEALRIHAPNLDREIRSNFLGYR